MSLFSGPSSAYGTYDMSNPVREESGKVRGRAITKKEPLTLQLIEDHLSGAGTGIGAIPIDEENNCRFGAIDVDFYQGLDLRTIVNKLKVSDLPMVVCRSKSGGAHIYLFSKELVPAANMRSKLLEIASFIGFGGSEIFPKQSQILAERGDVGSWINLPYFNGVKSLRYAVSSDGNALSLEQFLNLVDTIKVDKEWFLEKLVHTDSFADGPPCLQALSQIGYPEGSRNNGLFSIGVYLRKSRPDDWETQLDAYNHEYMQPPLSSMEVQGVAKSLHNKDYAYPCSRAPICNHCNQSLCRTRKHGVGSGSNGQRFPSFGQLTKLDSRPPVWYWSIDGQRIELSTVELQDPRLFQRRCIEVLNMVVSIPGRPAWEAALSQAMSSLTVIEVPADASPKGQFWDHVERFCTGRAQALTIEEIVLGKPFSSSGRTYFRMQDLLGFLGRNKFTEFRTVKISAMLRDAGAQHHFSNFNGRGVNYWSLKEFAKQTKGFDVPKDLLEGREAF